MRYFRKAGGAGLAGTRPCAAFRKAAMASVGLRFAPALVKPMRPIRKASARCSGARSERSATILIPVSGSAPRLMCALAMLATAGRNGAPQALLIAHGFDASFIAELVNHGHSRQQHF